MISSKFQSSIEPKQKIVVTREHDWSDIKIRAFGKVQYQSQDSDELRMGHNIEIMGFGTLSLQLHEKLSITLNGIEFNEITTKELNNQLSNASVLFWIITGLSTLGLLLMARLQVTGVFNTITIQLGVVLIYALTASMLWQKKYWFYFLGAGVFTFFTLLEIIDFEHHFQHSATTIRFIVRLVLFIMIIRTLPSIVNAIKTDSKRKK